MPTTIIIDLPTDMNLKHVPGTKSSNGFIHILLVIPTEEKATKWN